MNQDIVQYDRDPTTEEDDTPGTQLFIERNTMMRRVEEKRNDLNLVNELSTN